MLMITLVSDDYENFAADDNKQIMITLVASVE